MWQCCIISELRTVWQISNPIPKELEAHDFSRVSVHGRVDTTANFCREFGISYSKVVQYRRYHNTTDDEAIKHYLAIKEIEGGSGKQPTLVDICRRYGLNYGNVKSYRHKHGCSTDEAIKYYLIKQGDLS